MVLPPELVNIHLTAFQKKNLFQSIDDQDTTLNVGVYLSKKRLNENERDLISSTLTSLKNEGRIKVILDKYLN
ncbi:hypothetical protein D3C87_2187600 [compost metagenome]